MRFFYIAALLLPAAVAIDQAGQGSQELQAAQMGAASKTSAIVALINREVSKDD